MLLEITATTTTCTWYLYLFLLCFRSTLFHMHTLPPPPTRSLSPQTLYFWKMFHTLITTLFSQRETKKWSTRCVGFSQIMKENDNCWENRWSIEGTYKIILYHHLIINHFLWYIFYFYYITKFFFIYLNNHTNNHL